MEVFTEHVHVVVVNTKYKTSHSIYLLILPQLNYSVINLSLFSVVVYGCNFYFVQEHPVNTYNYTQKQSMIAYKKGMKWSTHITQLLINDLLVRHELPDCHFSPPGHSFVPDPLLCN